MQVLTWLPTSFPHVMQPRTIRTCLWQHMHIVTIDRKVRSMLLPGYSYFLKRKISMQLLHRDCTTNRFWYRCQTLLYTSTSAVLTITVNVQTENEIASNDKLGRVRGKEMEKHSCVILQKHAYNVTSALQASLSYSNCTFPFQWLFKLCKSNYSEDIRSITACFHDAVWQILKTIIKMVAHYIKIQGLPLRGPAKTVQKVVSATHSLTLI